MPETEQTRFVDRGTHLVYFAKNALSVCPRCGGPALVSSNTPYHIPFRPVDSRVTCLKCAFHVNQIEGKWFGPVRFSVKERCGHCGYKWLKRLQYLAAVDRAAAEDILITCPSCGHVSGHRGIYSIERFNGSPYDPLFGLPHWLQAPCCGETLWAYNAEHLAKLREYVAANLRQREKSGGPRAWSMFARLPQWMSAAKNRETVISAFDRLEQRLGIVPNAPRVPHAAKSATSA
jgi:hypothetical protein